MTIEQVIRLNRGTARETTWQSYKDRIDRCKFRLDRIVVAQEILGPMKDDCDFEISKSVLQEYIARLGSGVEH